MNPAPTGSTALIITIGIVVVARLAAAMVGLVPATITSTRSRTSSAARSGSRSSLPSAYRRSNTILRPST
jgi:hypothetical protein